MHGIAIGGSPILRPNISPISIRADYRTEHEAITLSRRLKPMRGRLWHRIDDFPNSEILSRVEEIVCEHAATSKRAKGKMGWKYKQRLVQVIPLGDFWDSLPGMIPIYEGNRLKLASLSDVLSMDRVVVILNSDEKNVRSKPPISSQYIWGTHLHSFSDRHLVQVFKNRSISRVFWLKSGGLAIEWMYPLNEEDRIIQVALPRRTISLAELPYPGVIGVLAHKANSDIYQQILLNKRNPFVSWALNAVQACQREEYGLSSAQARRLFSLIDQGVRYSFTHMNELTAYVKGWREMSDLPEELKPPDLEFTPEMFHLTYPNTRSSEPRLRV